MVLREIWLRTVIGTRSFVKTPMNLGAPWGKGSLQSEQLLPSFFRKGKVRASFGVRHGRGRDTNQIPPEHLIAVLTCSDRWSEFRGGVSVDPRDEHAYWRSYICTYELNFSWPCSTLMVPSPISRNHSLLHSRSFPILHSSQSAVLTIDRIMMSGEMIRLSISLRLAADFVHVMCIIYTNDGISFRI